MCFKFSEPINVMEGKFSPEIYDSWHDIQREKIEKIFQILGEGFLDSLKGRKILDVGAGSGVLEEFLARQKIEAIAAEPDMKMAASSKSKKNFVLAKGEEAPFRKGSFDVIFAIDSIHLIKRVDFDSLKKDGVVVVTTFFNDGNFDSKRKMVLKKLRGLKIEKEFSVETREKELVVVARK